MSFWGRGAQISSGLAKQQSTRESQIRLCNWNCHSRHRESLHGRGEPNFSNKIIQRGLSSMASARSCFSRAFSHSSVFQPLRLRFLCLRISPSICRLWRRRRLLGHRSGTEFWTRAPREPFAGALRRTLPEQSRCLPVRRCDAVGSSFILSLSTTTKAP